MTRRKFALAAAIVALTGGTLWQIGRGMAGAASLTEAEFPYRGVPFTQFVSDSFRDPESGTADDFYQWFEDGYTASPKRHPEQPELSLVEVLDWKRQELEKLEDPEDRARAEQEFAGWTWSVVKSVIPKFSLERGFEFRYTVERGERQCFLQSVLIAGLLQSTGMNAGVAMVYRNQKGQGSNLAHAVTVLRLANGADVVVDASDPTPFIPHQGLFMRWNGYHFLSPVYEGELIRAYKPQEGGAAVRPAQVYRLDYDFLRSQFDYYRGERAEGGIFATRLTQEGLATSAAALESSVRLCPQNPLAAYQLGRVYLKQGRRDLARTQLRKAGALYQKDGWTPPGVRSALQLVQR